MPSNSFSTCRTARTSDSIRTIGQRYAAPYGMPASSARRKSTSLRSGLLDRRRGLPQVSVMNSEIPGVADLKVVGSITDVYVFADRTGRPEWRVEWFDEDGAGGLKV